MRSIDADQNADGVWRCMQEVLHYELDAHLRNHAMILLKPHANNPEAERFVRSFLASHDIAVVRTGSATPEVMSEGGAFDKQYFQIMNNTKANVSDLKLLPSGLEMFRSCAGFDWDAGVADGRVVSADVAMRELAKTAADLAALCRESTASAKLAPSIQISSVCCADGSTKFVINGFAPHWREAFLSSGASLKWFAVEFSPAQVSWRRFREELLGATNPGEAPTKSIRGQFYQHWSKLGLQEQPNVLNNCIHASAGPLEGLREWMLWTGEALANHPLARSLTVAGAREQQLETWLGNPFIEDWRIGHETSSGPIFDCSENCDHSVFRASAIDFALRMDFSLSSLDKPGSAVGASRIGPRDTRMPSRNSAFKAASVVGQAPKVITLLHFNDVYNVEPRKKEPVGGIARFVTRMNELKNEAEKRNEPALCLFSGDAFNPSLTSTVTKGKHMVPALNAVGIDVACYGNHDFDFGVDELVDMAAACNFPWLISNVVDKVTGEPLANGLETFSLNWQAHRIGFIGLIEREWLVTLHTIDPDDVIFEDFCLCAKRLGKQLRDEGAELVIALSHMRMPNDYLLAQEVAEIDIVLGGHDHHYEVTPTQPYGTYVLNSGTDFRDMSEVRLEFGSGDGDVAEVGGRSCKILGVRRVVVDSAVAEDPESKALADDCANKVGKSMDKIIGETAVDLDCRFSSIRTRETNIGNFITDVMRAGLNTDVAIINSGTLRADAVIEAGALHVRDLLSILPMLDELCVLEISGQKLFEVLENGVSQYPRLEGRFLQLSGVSFTFDAVQAGGQRILKDTVSIGAAPLDWEGRYRVCTLDYMRGGKDGFDALKGAMCIADGEQAGILPTMVREHFESLLALNGETETVQVHRLQRAKTVMEKTSLEHVGDGPAPTQHYAISPAIEGRIRCLNPADQISGAG